MAIDLPNNKELDSLLRAVTAELDETFRKHEADDGTTPLAKASEGSPSGSPPPVDDAGGGAPPVGDAPPAGPEAGAVPPPGGDVPPAGPEAGAVPPPGGDVPPAGPEAGAPPDAGAGATDVATLEQTYAGMSDEELKSHYIALKAVIMQKMQAAQGAGAGPGGPPPGAGAPPPGVGAGPVGPPPGPPVAKAEFKAPPANGGTTKGAKVEKSEKDVEIEELKKSVDSLKAYSAKTTEVLTKVLTAPQRKAITRIPFQGKDGAVGGTNLKKSASEMNLTEVKAKVLALSKTPDLKKSDRDRLNQFTVGMIKAVDIEDLLQKD